MERATFVLIPGAGGRASFWNQLVPALQARDQDAIPVDIPQDDPAVGLPEYADLVEAAMGDRSDTVLVAQSLGGFTAPMVATRRAVRMIVLLNAMIPQPFELPGDWWAATGAEPARRAADLAAGRSPDFDVEQHFLHDLSVEVKAALFADLPRNVADSTFGQPCTFEQWPDVPIKVVVGRDDRFFPAGFQRRVARDRLGLGVDEIGGGHLAALSNPDGLADQLVSYLD